MKILLVDDEDLARSRIKTLLSEISDDIHIIGEASNGKEALQLNNQSKPDVILLDIQMPVLDGFDVASLLPEPKPKIIFITAYDEYAIQAFEVNAIDYLMKPVRKERLADALKRVKDQHSDNLSNLLDNQQERPLKKIPVLHKQDILLLDPSEIIWIEAQGPQLFSHTSDKSYRTEFKLDDLEQRLKNHNFFRIHRSYLVNLDKVKKLVPWFNHSYRVTLENGKDLDVARRRLSELKKILGL